jgi:hypothetical protein
MKKIVLNPVVIALAVMAVIFVATYVGGFQHVSYAR